MRFRSICANFMLYNRAHSLFLRQVVLHAIHVYIIIYASVFRGINIVYIGI